MHWRRTNLNIVANSKKTSGDRRDQYVNNGVMARDVRNDNGRNKGENAGGICLAI